MKYSPKVSIIVPVYNVEKYLSECMKSACNQTYTNIEIICVDDGSTDGSSAILRKYAEEDARIIIIKQENAGLSAARNTALSYATGEWIAMLDSDDYFDVQAIEKAISCCDIDVDVIQFGVRMFDENGDKIAPGLEMKFEGKQAVTEKLITSIYAGVWDKLWKKSFLDRCGVLFPVGLHMEDLAFSRCCLSLAKNVYFLRDKLYSYRYREDSIMGKHKNKQGGRRIFDYVKIAEFCLDFWKERNIRERFGYSAETPSFLEIELITNIKNCIHWWGAREYQHEAWACICELVDHYKLGSRLPEFLDLAFYYHLPPYVRPMIHEMIKMNRLREQENSELKRNLLLLANEDYILKRNHKFSLLSKLVWGEKRRKYKEKKKYYHDLLTRCRQIRKEAEI